MLDSGGAHEGGSVVLDQRLPLQTLREARTLELASAAASDGPGLAATGASIEIWWSGGESVQTSPLRKNGALREQLRALGYLEDDP